MAIDQIIQAFGRMSEFAQSGNPLDSLNQFMYGGDPAQAELRRLATAAAQGQLPPLPTTGKAYLDSANQGAGPQEASNIAGASAINSMDQKQEAVITAEANSRRGRAQSAVMQLLSMFPEVVLYGVTPTAPYQNAVAEFAAQYDLTPEELEAELASRQLRAPGRDDRAELAGPRHPWKRGDDGEGDDGEGDDGEGDLGSTEEVLEKYGGPLAGLDPDQIFDAYTKAQADGYEGLEITGQAAYDATVAYHSDRGDPIGELDKDAWRERFGLGVSTKSAEENQASSMANLGGAVNAIASEFGASQAGYQGAWEVLEGVLPIANMTASEQWLAISQERLGAQMNNPRIHRRVMDMFQPIVGQFILQVVYNPDWNPYGNVDKETGKSKDPVNHPFIFQWMGRGYEEKSEDFLDRDLEDINYDLMIQADKDKYKTMERTPREERAQEIVLNPAYQVAILRSRHHRQGYVGGSSISAELSGQGEKAWNNLWNKFNEYRAFAKDPMGALEWFSENVGGVFAATGRSGLSGKQAVVEYKESALQEDVEAVYGSRGRQGYGSVTPIGSQYIGPHMGAFPYAGASAPMPTPTPTLTPANIGNWDIGRSDQPLVPAGIIPSWARY